MNRGSKGTIVIGAREILFAVIGLAALALIGLIVMLVVTRLQGRSQLAEATVTPSGAASLVTATPQTASGPTSTPLNLGATLPPDRPTPTLAPETFTHEIQAGETLSSIATLYGIDLQTLLTANGLTLDSVIQEGNSLIIPLPPTQSGTWHTVQPGETLTIIANRYGATVEAIRAANGLNEDSVIISGQRLRVPGISAAAADSSPEEPPEATPIVQAHAATDLPDRAFLSDWPRSILEGNLEENYPLQFSQDRFTVHYQPGTYAGENLGQTMGLVDNSLRLIERRLEVTLDGSFDVYAAGTLFAAPNAHLRGLSNSFDRRVFVLHDGTGTAADNAYFFTHELTHMVTRNTWGSPGAAFVLSEGVATWVGRPVLEEGGYLNYDDMCAAIYAAERLPAMTAIETDWQAFLGHIRDPFNYFGSACFVDFLVDTYGLDAVRQLYISSDYEAVTGRSLAWLDTEFRASLEGHVPFLAFNPEELAEVETEVSEAYRFVFNNYNATETMHSAYVAVDQARIALWKGDFTGARRWLATAYDITGYVP